MRRLLFTFGFVLLGCGGPAPAEESAGTPAVSGGDEAPPPAPPRAEGAIHRAELESVLEAGLGQFLGHVVTEPHLEEGRFVGHRLLELRAPFFEGVDLRPGDTLVRVNGGPIERPEQALEAFEGLRVASELTLDLLRDGEPRQLRFRIDER